MGLFESIEKFLIKNNGESSVFALYDALRSDYASDTIGSFLSDNSNAFIIDHDTVKIKDYKINLFIRIISSFLKEEQVVDANQIRYLAELFLQNSKYGYEEHARPNGFFGDSRQEHYIRKSQAIFQFINKDDWDNKEFVYNLSVRFYSLLLEQILHGKTLYSTPNTLIDLILHFIPPKEKLIVYNPASGLLKLLTAISVFSDSEINAYSSEIDPSIYEIGTFLARSNNVQGHFENNNSLDDWKWNTNKYDLIVCNPPFNLKTDNFRWNEYSYSDFSLNIVTKSLGQLSEDGVGIFLLSDNVLYGTNNELRRFRKEIVESRMLKNIISLPTNLFAPVSSIKTSLVIFNKDWRKGKVQFLDAASKKYYSIKRDKSIELNIDRIIDKLKFNNNTSLSVVNEDSVQYNSNEFAEVSVSDIEKNKYSLQIHNYISASTNFEGEDYKALGEILETKKLLSAKGIDIPFIRISELNGDVLDSPENLPFNKTRTVGKVIDHQAILIGSIGGSHKPTLFTGSFIAELSNNVLALTPRNIKDVFLPYLIQELNQKYVIDQMTFMSVGTTSLRHLRREDLFRVKVKFPDIETQRQIYNSRIGFVSQDLIDSMESATLTEEQVFGTIKHEIGNILRGPGGFLDLLPDFFDRNNIKLEQRIVDMEGAETIGQMIEMSQKNIHQVYSVLENMKGVLFSEEKYFNPKNQELKSFLRNKLESENYNGDLDWYIGVNGEFDKPKNIYAEIDTLQFEYIIRNICLNAIHHGQKNDRLTLVIDIISENELIQIHFINNGEPFPADFGIDDFTAFGKKQGKSKGSGLGGYVINQIVKNHHGTLEILPGGDIIKIKKGNTEIAIEENVDVLITIPKKQ